ncbi:MAG TPA: CvpA family protein [Caulobacterales bacterium]|jgi:membrane protein required for colicin V production|nr:CvpA family protein [Caulobacterales bacterium]
MEFTAFDFAVIAIVLLSSIMAFARGLLREVFSIVAFAVAAVALYFEISHQFLGGLLEGLIQPKILADIAAAIVVFLAVFVIITFLTSTAAKAIHSSGEIGAIDRAAGLVFGAARGVLVMVLVVLVVRHVTGPTVPMPDLIAKARTFAVLNAAAEGLESFVPKAREAIKSRDETESASPPP